MEKLKLPKDLLMTLSGHMARLNLHRVTVGV